MLGVRVGVTLPGATPIRRMTSSSVHSIGKTAFRRLSAKIT